MQKNCWSPAGGEAKVAWDYWPGLVPTGAPLSPPRFHNSPLASCRFFTPKVGGKGLGSTVLLRLEEQRLCSAPRASRGGAGCWLTPVLPARQTLAPCALRRGAPGQRLPLNSFFRADSEPGETQARQSSPSEQRLRQGSGPTPVICLLCPLPMRWDAQRGHRDAAKPHLCAGG